MGGKRETGSTTGQIRQMDIRFGKMNAEIYSSRRDQDRAN